MCVSTNWRYNSTNKIPITTFSLAEYVPVKYGINFTADMWIFVWAVEQVWYYHWYTHCQAIPS